MVNVIFSMFTDFRYTRRWLNFFYGIEMANAMFDFAQSMRDLQLNQP